MLMKDSPWAVLGKYFIPPVQYVVFLLLILAGPDEHIDGMCLLGQIAVPLICYAFSAFIIYMAWKNESKGELAYYIVMTVLQTIYFLPGIKVFDVLRPFVRRPEEEIQAEREEKIRAYKTELK